MRPLSTDDVRWPLVLLAGMWLLSLPMEWLSGHEIQLASKIPLAACLIWAFVGLRKKSRIGEGRG